MKKTKAERETIITMNEADDAASIWTCSPEMTTKLIKSGYVPSKTDSNGVYFKILKKSLKFSLNLQ